MDQSGSKAGHKVEHQELLRTPYALDATTLPSDWEPMFVNLNDGSNEGIRHKSKPFFSIQFQPDGVEFLFDEFIKML